MCNKIKKRKKCWEDKSHTCPVPSLCVPGAMISERLSTCAALADALGGRNDLLSRRPLLWAECSKQLLPGQWVIRAHCCKQKKPSLANLNRTDLVERMLASTPHHQEGWRPSLTQRATQSKLVINPDSALTPGNQPAGNQQT